MWFCEACATTYPSPRERCASATCGGAVRRQLDRDEMTALVERVLGGALSDADATLATRVYVVNAKAHGLAAPRPMIERAIEDRWPPARLIKAIFAGERTAARTPKKRSAAAKKALEKARAKKR